MILLCQCNGGYLDVHLFDGNTCHILYTAFNSLLYSPADCRDLVSEADIDCKSHKDTAVIAPKNTNALCQLACSCLADLICCEITCVCAWIMGSSWPAICSFAACALASACALTASETACAMTVAIAAPRTPSEKRVMKAMSRTMRATASQRARMCEVSSDGGKRDRPRSGRELQLGDYRNRRYCCDSYKQDKI